jgi:tungstate transport system substrate-binding protein
MFINNNKRRKLAVLTLVVVMIAASALTFGCTAKEPVQNDTGNANTKDGKPEIESEMTLATTTSTRDTGLLDVLVPAFDKKYGVTTKVVAVGTGEALEMGKQGNADVLLVHARKSEDEFVASGYGINRKDVMYNFFFVVGPKNDPAGAAKEKDAEAAMKKIAESKSKFVSRGDQSGTHKKELAIWEKYGLKPQGEAWYKEAGQGMGDTLTMASEMGAYTLSDSGTWYAFQDKVDLKIVVEGDPILFNPYGVVAVNPEKYPNIHNKAAMAFIDFITSEEGQKIIGDYKKNGQQLFMPDAKK